MNTTFTSQKRGTDVSLSFLDVLRYHKDRTSFDGLEQREGGRARR